MKPRRKYEWSSLAFHKDVEKRVSSIDSEKIISKFKGFEITLEKLYSKNSNLLFSSRLNDTERIICTIGKKENDGKDNKCLIVLKILTDHKYYKSNYLNNNVLKQNDIKIVAKLPRANNIEVIDQKVYGIHINNNIIILDQEQQDILDAETNKPSFFKINGAAGSGKTTIAELLMYNDENEEGKKWLYVTKEERLVSNVKDHYEELKQALNNTKKQVYYKTYKDLIAEKLGLAKNCKFSDIVDFQEWIKKQLKFKTYTEKYHNEQRRIGREIYEDIRKLHGKSSNDALGKKESYGHEISEDLLKSYKTHLKSDKIDLSLIHSTELKIENDEKYDCIIVDEAQDLGKSELSCIKSFLKKEGKAYFFMDSNQSLTDDFNLTSQYIRELSHESSNMHVEEYKLKEYGLKNGYRTPSNITELANQVLKMKRIRIGGSLGKDAQEYIADNKSFNGIDTAGYIEWVDKETQEERINEIKERARESINHVVLIPDDSLKKLAEEYFSKGEGEESSKALICTTQEFKGLEYPGIMLFGFLSEKHALNSMQKEWRSFLPAFYASKESNNNFPKQALGKDAILFTNLFVGVTRPTHSLYFVETGDISGLSLFKKEIIEKSSNKEKEKELIDDILSIEDIERVINTAMQLEAQVESNTLLQYCSKALKSIEKFLISVTFPEVMALEYLKTEIMYKKDNANKKNSKIKKFLEDVKNLLHTKAQELNHDKVQKLNSSDDVLQTAESPNRPCIEKKSIRSRAKSNRNSVTISPCSTAETMNNHFEEIEQKEITRDQILNRPIDHWTADQLAQVCIDDTVHCNVLSMIILNHKLSNIDSNSLEGFIFKITSKALNEIMQGINTSALYDLIFSGTLEDILNKVRGPEVKKLIQNFEEQALRRIGPSGWSPLHYIYSHNSLLKKLDKLSNQRIKHMSKYKGYKISFKCDTRLMEDRSAINIPIFEAAINNDINTIKYLLENGSNIDTYATASGSTKVTALHGAIAGKCTQAAMFLLSKGAKIKNINSSGFDALNLAAQHGCTDLVKPLLEAGAGIEDFNDKGLNPLHMAAGNGMTDTVECLLSEGANIEAITRDEEITALFLAAVHGRSDVVRLLLSHSANVEAPDKDGDTPLYAVVHSVGVIKEFSIIIDLLLNAGAEVDYLCKDVDYLCKNHDKVFPAKISIIIKCLSNYVSNALQAENIQRRQKIVTVIDELKNCIQYQISSKMDCSIESVEHKLGRSI